MFGYSQSPRTPRTVDEVIDIVKRTITYHNKQSNMYIVLYQGKRVKLYNGKSHWSSMGRATGAISNYLYRVMPWDDRRIFNEQKFKDWMNENFKVVLLSEYEENTRKLKNL